MTDQLVTLHLTKEQYRYLQILLSEQSEMLIDNREDPASALTFEGIHSQTCDVLGVDPQYGIKDDLAADEQYEWLATELDESAYGPQNWGVYEDPA